MQQFARVLQIHAVDPLLAALAHFDTSEDLSHRYHTHTRSPRAYLCAFAVSSIFWRKKTHSFSSLVTPSTSLSPPFSPFASNSFSEYNCCSVSLIQTSLARWRMRNLLLAWRNSESGPRYRLCVLFVRCVLCVYITLILASHPWPLDSLLSYRRIHRRFYLPVIVLMIVCICLHSKIYCSESTHYGLALTRASAIFSCYNVYVLWTGQYFERWLGNHDIERVSLSFSHSPCATFLDQTKMREGVCVLRYQKRKFQDMNHPSWLKFNTWPSSLLNV